jgi:hypothetical protein
MHHLIHTIAFLIWMLSLVIGNLNTLCACSDFAMESKEQGRGIPEAEHRNGERRRTPGSSRALSHWLDATWEFERIHAPKMFSQMSDRCLALDSDGHPHIAYGEDFLYYASHDGTSWNLETVDHAIGVGWHANLALDEHDRPHIVYYDALNLRIRYAYHDGTSWQIETVDTVGTWTFGQNRALSMDLDRFGRPHLGYYEAENRDLKYAYYDGVAWKIESVDVEGDVGAYTSLMLDQAGRPHISYYNHTTRDLKYAYYNGSDWINELVDGQDYAGRHSSLALDSSGHPHISYYHYRNPNDTELRHAYYDGLAWRLEVVDNAPWSGWFTSLVIDGDDRAHIAYYNAMVSDLRYAYKDGSLWQVETVESEGPVGYYVSLDVDAKGNPHISYYGADPKTLRYAYYDGTAWLVEIVDRAGSVGYHSSLALDLSDQPHVSYLGGGLRYAHHDGAEWQIERVDSAGYSETSLAVDSLGRPHIAYCRPPVNRAEICSGLKYAWNDGLSWQVELVEGGNVGVAASLVLDSAGRPHIAYADMAEDDLKYARYDGAGWQIETVDREGCVGTWATLALDSLDRPHISYYDCSNSALKYAWYDGRSNRFQSAGIWQIETVDDEGLAGLFGSLALDSKDRPHISYHDFSNLKYAHYNGAEWQIDVVDKDQVGRYSSIDLDSQDLPHIAYCLHDSDYQCVELRYAHSEGSRSGVAGSWQVEVVDDVGKVGEAASLVLDSAGFPHISYRDLAYGDAKYAYKVCVPISRVEVDGPMALLVGQEGVYRADALPVTITYPVTYTWDNGVLSSTAVYSWSVVGTHTIAVTGTNRCGQVQGNWVTRVWAEWPYTFFLPVILDEFSLQR